MQERGYVFWVVAILVVSVGVYVVIKGIRDSRRRTSELGKTANEIGAGFFAESSITQFLKQLQALSFPMFSSGYDRVTCYDRVTNIFQADIEGTTFHFDYMRSNSNSSTTVGSAVLLVNRRKRCTEPIIVSNDLIEYFRRLWHVGYPELRAEMRLRLKQKPACHVEVTNDGLLYFSKYSEPDEVEGKIQFASELFAVVEAFSD